MFTIRPIDANDGSKFREGVLAVSPDLLEVNEGQANGFCKGIIGRLSEAIPECSLSKPKTPAGAAVCKKASDAWQFIVVPGRCLSHMNSLG